MNDGLDYIREAIAKFGTKAQIEVVRWEKDHASGYYNRPFKVLIKADVALKQLSLPLNKRARIWRYIRPIGMTMDGYISEPKAANRLNSPDLIEELTAKIRAELQAEFAATTDAKPKRTKKVIEQIDIPEETDSTNLENA
jgi:hypothetical protein